MKRLMVIMEVGAAVALGVSGCAPTPGSAVAQASLPRETRPDVPIAALQEFTTANNAFALDLYSVIRAEPGNLVFSPFSISTAVAMTYAGARGETESQMAEAMHYGLPQTELHRAFNQLDLSLAEAAAAGSSGEQPLQLRVVNSVWAERTLTLLQEYLDVIATNYGAGVRLADFVAAYEPARREINAWVRTMTEKRIDELIPAGAIDNTTKMVLVNAIYFRADWLHQFDANDTGPGPFFTLGNSEVQVPMMANDLPGASYASLPGYQVVELPYQAGRAVMDIIVPDAGSFESFEAAFGEGVLREALGTLEPVTLHLVLPKFSFSADFDLKDQLSSLGMPLAFDENNADFSGMTGGRDLFISQVLHQAFVAVDEEGTEAAAATGVIMGPTSAIMPGVTLVVDRPFIFLIRDLRTQQILFMGRVVNPAD